MTERLINHAGYSMESIAAMYETDAALAEWMEASRYGFPPAEHYFHSALRAETEESRIDRMEGVRDE